MKKEKTLGHIKNARLVLTEPMEVDFDMDYNSIMILIGQNGTGKSFILKATWMITTMANYFLMSRSPFDEESTLQFLADNTFKDNNLDGDIEFTWESEEEGQFQSVVSSFEKGKVTKCECYFDENTVNQGAPVFMSAVTRKMDEHVKYYQLKKMLGIPPGMPSTEAHMKKMLEMYRLYDIIFMEQFADKITTQTTPKIIETFNERFQKFDEKFFVQDVRIDYSIPDMFYIDEKGVERSVTSLGAGHQSLFGMLLFQCY